MVLAARDKGGSIPISDVAGLVTLMAHISLNQVKVSQKGKWQINVGKDNTSVSLSAAPNSSINLVFDTEQSVCFLSSVTVSIPRF